MNPLGILLLSAWLKVRGVACRAWRETVHGARSRPVKPREKPCSSFLRIVNNLRALNPYLSEAEAAELLDFSVAVIMHANRVGQTNRSLSEARAMERVGVARASERAFSKEENCRISLHMLSTKCIVTRKSNCWYF